jgi:hypothetical protein
VRLKPSVAGAPVRKADTSSDEIEITPEMIEAGVEAFSLYEPNDRPGQIVWSVFRAMRLAEL